ncbi:pectin lyase-like protein [Aspergillus novoparasiticus]|uniref:Pectin lyase-like protein n=1 Tax=Aspergillus novoparasiticus TaxID=986946 RepID=A0A5N6F8E6_9EURO|nr:pectin lyase-like protein [Aspergillus novoparasiticus]
MLLWSSGILLLLCANIIHVAGHGHNNHGHLHHRRDQSSTVISDAASATTVEFSLSDAKALVEKAKVAMAVANKARLENSQSNQYRLQKSTAQKTAAKAAPDLQLTWATEVSTNARTARTAVANSSGDSHRYTYSISPGLANAARMMAESNPPGPTAGDPAAVAARIQQKYALKTNDTNVPPQKLRRPNGLGIDVPTERQTSRTDSSPSKLSKRDVGVYWMTTMEQRGESPFAPSGYKVWRNVKDYGAKGDGVTDDTAAINRAISDGGRCGVDCGSSTIYPAVVYFPPGTYLVSSPIIQYFNTQFLGDPLDYPTILAASSFVGLGVITSDVYTGETSEWYLNTNNFLRSVKNFKMDITRTDPNAYVCAIHWQVAQGTSLENIDFYMMQDDTTTQQGIYMENGSGGFLANLTFVGGNFGAYLGNQQFTTSHLAFVNCNSALQIHWDWAWTMHDVIIESCNQGVVIVGGAGGSMSTGQPVGSLILVDSMIANTPTGIITSLYQENSTALLLQNTGFFNVETAIIDNVEGKTLMAGGNEVLVDSWGFGLFANSSSSTFINGDNIPVMNRSSTLLGTTGYNRPNFLARRRPAYTDLGMSQVIDVKAAGATGDGVTDDTAILNSILSQAANMSSIVYFPFGVYVIKNRLNIPVGSRIIGQAWSQIMAKGARFQDEANPQVAIRVGRPGDVGIIEIQDMLFTVSGPTAGAVLMEWNVHESTPGSAAMWDSHFRVGGAIGSDLQATNCPKSSGVNTDCKAASLLLHITSDASVYLENVWAWVADHDLDVFEQTQIDVYSGRGILIESQGPVWLYGTASEHSVLYQYQLSGAKDVMMGMIQTESPYFQPVPQAPAPFTPGLFPNDPRFEDCDEGSCGFSWALRIVDSNSIYSLGAGLYSWFSDYNQDCLETENCQERSVQIEQSTDIWLYNLITKATVEMVSPTGETPTYAKDNVNGYISSILAWVREANTTIGQRTFSGLQIYSDGALEGLTAPCVTALTETIKCSPYLYTFQSPSVHGSLGNTTYTDIVCDDSCGESLALWFNTVSSSCAGQNITGAPPTKVGGYMWQGYNETCLLDSSGEYCNDIIADFTAVDSFENMPQDELCSSCYIEKLQMMQSSSYSIYDDHYKRVLEYAQNKCGITGPTDVPPQLVVETPAETPLCASGQTHTAQSDDTCDSLALQYSVASAAIFRANSDVIYNCSWVPEGAELCMPLSCGSQYTLNSNDTCSTIEESQGLTVNSLRKYNPWILKDCSNLQVASQIYGNILCLEPQAGIYTVNNTNSGSIPSQSTGYMPYVISPGNNATVANGTTLYCGKWHVAAIGESCASICVEEQIPSDLFLEVNPSLTSAESCSSLLANGTSYCVGPLYEWDGIGTVNNTLPLD